MQVNTEDIKKMLLEEKRSKSALNDKSSKKSFIDYMYARF